MVGVRETPGASSGTTKQLTPAERLVPGARAYTSAAVAFIAHEIAVFSPRSRQPPGTRSAMVRKAAASEPEPGSVNAIATVHLPLDCVVCTLLGDTTYCSGSCV